MLSSILGSCNGSISGFYADSKFGLSPGDTSNRRFTLYKRLLKLNVSALERSSGTVRASALWGFWPSGSGVRRLHMQSVGGA